MVNIHWRRWCYGRGRELLPSPPECGLLVYENFPPFGQFLGARLKFCAPIITTIRYYVLIYHTTVVIDNSSIEEDYVAGQVDWFGLTFSGQLVLLPPPRRLCFCWFLFVCLCVCVQDNSKSYGRIFLKFWGNVGHGISYKWFDFGGDPAGILDCGSLWNFRYHCGKGGISEPLAKRRWWRHLANSIVLAEVPASYGCFLVLICFH